MARCLALAVSPSPSNCRKERCQRGVSSRRGAIIAFERGSRFGRHVGAGRVSFESIELLKFLAQRTPLAKSARPATLRPLPWPDGTARNDRSASQIM